MLCSWPMHIILEKVTSYGFKAKYLKLIDSLFEFRAELVEFLGHTHYLSINLLVWALVFCKISF